MQSWISLHVFPIENKSSNRAGGFTLDSCSVLIRFSQGEKRVRWERDGHYNTLQYVISLHPSSPPAVHSIIHIQMQRWHRNSVAKTGEHHWHCSAVSLWGCVVRFLEESGRVATVIWRTTGLDNGLCVPLLQIDMQTTKWETANLVLIQIRVLNLTH